MMIIDHCSIQHLSSSIRDEWWCELSNMKPLNEQSSFTVNICDWIGYCSYSANASTVESDLFSSIVLSKMNCLITSYWSLFADKVSFPLRSEEVLDEVCSICYMHRLDEQIPIISCDNEKCHLIYHTECIRKWFSTIKDSKTFLNVTSGRCPLCKEVFFIWWLISTLCCVYLPDSSLTIFIRSLQKLSTSFAQLIDK